MAAADGPAVADLGVAHLAGGVGQERYVLDRHGALFDVHVAGERTDGDVVPGVADVAQLVDAADVDQDAGLGQAQLHQRHSKQ